MSEPINLCVTSKARPRVETRYEYGIRSGWDDDRRSGIDLVFTRKGIEVGGFYDSMVGIEGGFIPWTEVDGIRADVMKRTPVWRRGR